MTGREKFIGGSLMTVGFLLGTYAQSYFTKQRLRKAIDRAFAKCETAQDIVYVEQVLDAMASIDEK